MSRSRDRALIWLVASAGAIALAVAFAGVRGWVPQSLGLVSAGLFVVCLLLVAVIGWQRHRNTLADRDAAARAQMIVMIAARLNTQDNEALEAMAARGGPAGEAAKLVLDGRAERAGRPPRGRPPDPLTR
ncbi:MAG TPA: hypothetical protein VFO06_01425 [Gemmatimonadales bacterium]|nr:hypothetical protein [Gemmatimonadales bacterium]